MKLLPLLIVALCWLTEAQAQPLALPPPPPAAIEQRVGAQLPLVLPLSDERGHTVSLGDFFRDRPVLLVPGYYSCPELCGLLMHGLLESVHDARLGPGDLAIVRVSIDPQDTPVTASRQQDDDLAYAGFLRAPVPDLHLLVGSAANTGQLARTIGYRFEPGQAHDARAARFAHPAAVIVATPDGRVSRYLMGVRFDPAELRAAVQVAAQGRTGSLTDRLALLCAHFDPRIGRYSELVMNALRAVAALTVAGLAGWCWRRRGRSGAAS